MKKIRSIEQLEYEKKLLEQKQQILHYKIKSGWSDVKNDLKPGKLFKDFFSSLIKKKGN